MYSRMINEDVSLFQVIGKAHNKSISCCAISSSNNIILTGSLDSSVKIWKLDKHKQCFYEEKKKSPLKPRHKYGVTIIKYSPAEIFFATASIDGHVFLYNSNDFQLLNKFTQINNHSIRSLCFSPNCTMIVTGDNNGTICAWKFYDQCLIKTAQDHYGTINVIVFSYDSKIIVSCCSFGFLKVWNVISSTLENLTFMEQAHDLGINCAEFQNTTYYNYYLLATGGNDNVINIWKISQVNMRIEKIWCLRQHTNAVISLTFNNDDILASTGLDNMILFWNFKLNPPNSIFCLKKYTKNINSIIFSKDSKFLITVNSDRFIIIYQLKNENNQTKFDCKELTRTKTYEKNIEIIFRNKSNNIRLIQILNIDSITNSLELFKNNTLIMAIKNKLKQYEYCKESSEFKELDDTGEFISNIDDINFSSDIDFLQFSNLCDYLIIRRVDRVLNIWNFELGLRNTDDNGSCRICTFSLSGEYLITVSEQEILTIWETRNLKNVASFQENYSSITCTSMNIDNSLIAYGTFNGYLIILILKNSTLSIAFEESHCHDLGTTCCNFNNNHTQLEQIWSSKEFKYALVTSGMDGLIKLWRIQSHNNKTVLMPWHVFTGHQYGVEKVEFIHVNNHFIYSVSCNDKQIRIWSILNPTSALYVLEHDSMVIDSCLSSDGRILATSCLDKSIWIWQLDIYETYLTYLDHNQISDRFLCPISKEIMQKPVYCSDGFTYDYSSILNWFQLGHNTSPMTNQTLVDMQIIENHELKLEILKVTAKMH